MKKVMLLVIVLTGMILVQGCGEPCVMFVQRPEFPVSEYVNIPKPGTGSATVKGQVFMRTIVGDVKHGAGSTVTLNPVTSYSTAAYEVIGNFIFDNSRFPVCPFPTLSEPDKRYVEYWCEQQADAEGKFEFVNVPTGEYFVNSSVVWLVPSGNYISYPQGGTITKRVTVKDNETVQIMLTR